MILPDTSAWVDYLRRPDLKFAQELRRGQLLTHPYVIGELALGGLTSNLPLAKQMKKLAGAVVASPDEVLMMIERDGLIGSGIGYVDAHLLAATRLTPGSRLLTLDQKLHTVAARLGLAASIHDDKNPL